MISIVISVVFRVITEISLLMNKACRPSSRLVVPSVQMKKMYDKFITNLRLFEILNPSHTILDSFQYAMSKFSTNFATK